ncbi:MAG: hypothetical protein ACWA41_10940 [Putridiphycobacter sp.]
MQFLKFLVILVLGLFFITGCNNNLSPKKYVNWVDDPENGLIKTAETQKSKLTCTYTPAEYTILKQFKPDEPIDEKTFTEQLEGVKDMYHFVFRFENKDGSNLIKDNYTTQEQFQTKSMYLSYDIRSDLKLVQGTDTTMCALNHHERTYSNTPYEQILLAFPKVNDNDITLIFNDRVFGFNRTKFFFSKETINSVPQLDLKH